MKRSSMGIDHGGSSSVQWLLVGHKYGNTPGLGARASADRTMTFQKNPVYGVSGGTTPATSISLLASASSIRSTSATPQ